MCGIAGKVVFDQSVVDQHDVRRMCNTLVHRGPDAEGIHVGPGVGLGQRRLSVIDLSDAAIPPLASEDETLWIVFNGEIYNYRELRQELLARGHRFRTATDTEVLLHLYEEEGEECLTKLRGMFAFAIWDTRSQTLFAARDRLGKKPFVYARTPRAFLFGSEIKAIMTDPDMRSAPNFRAIDQYLTWQYVPSPQTAFDGVFKLPPAHFLRCDARGKVEIRRFWLPPNGPKFDQATQDIEDELGRLLRECVRMRMIADVPLGALLSGGIDSGSVVALMAQESSRPVKTFSIGFDDDEFNELPYARMVAERYGTDHHEFLVRPSAVETLPQLVRLYNEPFADSSAIPTWYVSNMTREHVTVALTGDGGDESFAGYTRYGQILAWSRFDVIPSPIRGMLGAFAEHVTDQFPYSNVTARLGRGIKMFASNLPERYRLIMSILKTAEKRELYTPQFKALTAGNEVGGLDLPWDASMDSLDWMMRNDQSYYLPECLMVKADIASMANSLELRAPFLDHQLVEFAARVPSRLKHDGTTGKQLLRKVVRELLPPDILAKRKTGFGVPLAKWFRGELAPLLRATLLDDRAADRNLFKPRVVRRMVEEHHRGARDWSNRLWALLFLELWFREFFT